MLKTLCVDDHDLDSARDVAALFGAERFGYIVTPNVDHIIRYHDDAHFRAVYDGATYVLLDSRFLALLLRLFKRQRFRVCVGSDLTASVLDSVIKQDDVAVLVGGTPRQADWLRKQFGLSALHHIDPPMNFIRDPQAVDACVRSIEATSPFRFCFLAIGSPQQEIIAHKLQVRGIARGLALCVGASINFLSGSETRAPKWMRSLNCEWLYRLLQNPRRMATRYLVRGPRILLLLWRIELQLRAQSAQAKPSLLPES